MNCKIGWEEKPGGRRIFPSAAELSVFTSDGDILHRFYYQTLQQTLMKDVLQLLPSMQYLTRYIAQGEEQANMYHTKHLSSPSKYGRFILHPLNVYSPYIV